MTMNNLRVGIDAILGVVMTAGLTFGAFGLGTRFFSITVGGLLAAGVFLSLSAWLLAGQLRERRYVALIAGRCPRCNEALRAEHRHRHWDGAQWLAASTTWDCEACSYGHAESWPCPDCAE
jgi:hypothetical protein